MNKKDQKLIEYMLKHEENDSQKAFSSGWDEALKNQWISVNERLPQKTKRVLAIYEYEGDTYIVSTTYHADGKWMFGKGEVLAWMPIPSFDEILEANKYVLKRLKEK